LNEKEAHMVNINHINELTQSKAVPAVGTPKTEKTGGFENVLTQALGQANQAGQTDETETPGMETTTASALGEIPSTGLYLQDQAAIVSEKTDALLGLLDAYSNQLENPGVSLKSIAPILEQINQKADSLLKESVSLGLGDTNLKEIATQTVIAAQTEYQRFQRGDYVS
jgi:flagellar hook-basal body complex protein FliE